MNSQSASNTPTILIVDDNATLRRNLQEFLSFEGYRIAVADGAQEALKLLRTEPELPSVIVLDVLMYEMNGVEMAQVLFAEENWRHIPIVLLSSQDRKHLGELSPNIKEMLVKPATLKEMADAVRQALSG